jgi:hypothetical protein
MPDHVVIRHVVFRSPSKISVSFRCLVRPVQVSPNLVNVLFVASLIFSPLGGQASHPSPASTQAGPRSIDVVKTREESKIASQLLSLRPSLAQHLFSVMVIQSRPSSMRSSKSSSSSIVKVVGDAPSRILLGQCDNSDRRGLRRNSNPARVLLVCLVRRDSLNSGD